MKLNEIENIILQCKKCERLCNVNPYPMPHIQYSKKSNILCVARNPGLENVIPDEITPIEFMEFYRQKWYDCRISKYLRSLLGDDIVKNDLFFTNICKCSSPKNSQLLSNEVENCKQYLIDQIEIIKPKIIITFGSDAIYSLLNKKINEAFCKQLKYNNIPVISLFHPSYFIYASDKTITKKQSIILNRIRKLYERQFQL